MNDHKGSLNAAFESPSFDPAGCPLNTAVEMLLSAHRYAADSGTDPWQFAVSLAELRWFGVRTSDLRWLVLQGLAEHAVETTTPAAGERHFTVVARHLISDMSCFVLSKVGAGQLNNGAGSTLAGTPNDSSFQRRNGTAASHENRPPHNSRSGPQNGRLHSVAASPFVPPNGSSAEPEMDGTLPFWDPERHELRIEGTLVKRFKWPAPNQEAVLSVFEEDGWPPRIDDPLPPQALQDSRRRLHDTIKCLNRNHKHRLIRFRGDGTGEGVVWEHRSHAPVS